MPLDSSQLPRWGVAFELASSTAIVNRPPHLWRLWNCDWVTVFSSFQIVYLLDCIHIHFKVEPVLWASTFSDGLSMNASRNPRQLGKGSTCLVLRFTKQEEVMSVYRKSCKPFSTLMSEYCIIEEEHRKSHYSSSRNGKKGYLGTFLHRGKQWSRRFLGMIVWDPSVCKSNRLHIDILQFSFIRLGGIFYKFL